MVLPMPSQWHVSGYSRAGEATGFYVKQMRWFLDAGVPTSQIKPDIVFISHSHTDHSMMLPLLVDRRKPLRVYAPAEAVPFLAGYVAGMNKLNQQSDDYEDRSAGYTYIPVTTGQTVQIDNKFWAHVIDCEHPVTSVGYCFFEKRKRLKDEFKGKSGRELGQLRKDGVELNEEAELPYMAFLGDTTGKVLVDHGKLLSTYPVVFIECTFFQPDHKDAAAGSQHLHWSDLRPFALEHRDTTFILIHFSKRYSDDEIHAFFDNERASQRELEAAEDAAASATGGCPKRRPAFDNVVVWLAGLGQHTAESARAGPIGE